MSQLNRNLSVVAALLSMASHAAAQNFVNGSLVRAAGNGLNMTGDGWTVAHANPDVDDALDQSFSGNYQYASPLVASPDGGQFNGFSLVDAVGLREGISQSVSGFTISNRYQITFYMNNIGLVDTSFGGSVLTHYEDASVQLYVDDVLQDATVAVAMGSGWGTYTLSFLATAETSDIKFRGFSPENGVVGSAYVLVDGFSIAEIPEPSSALIAGVGLLGLTRRRRRVG